MQLEDVKKLASLARIDMNEEEMQEVAKDFDAILAYVGQVKEVSSKQETFDDNQKPEDYFLYNIVREDIATNKTGEHTEKILDNSPDTESGFIKVKQIM